MPIAGGLDIHRKQITFDYLDTATGEVKRGQIAPADRAHLRAWLARFAGRDDVAFALEGCTGWRYVAEELAGAGVAAGGRTPNRSSCRRARKAPAGLGKPGCPRRPRPVMEQVTTGPGKKGTAPAIPKPPVPSAGSLPCPRRP